MRVSLPENQADMLSKNMVGVNSTGIHLNKIINKSKEPKSHKKVRHKKRKAFFQNGRDTVAVLFMFLSRFI
jgi:hypothetical protein